MADIETPNRRTGVRTGSPAVPAFTPWSAARVGRPSLPKGIRPPCCERRAHTGSSARHIASLSTGRPHPAQKAGSTPEHAFPATCVDTSAVDRS